jgi:hypothetical protein
MIGKKGQQRLGTIYDSLSEHSRQELNKVMACLKKSHHNPTHSFEMISELDPLEKPLNNL